MKAHNFIPVCMFILLSFKDVKPFKMSEETFLYFAYGSNLLSKRMHINNPTATFFSIAKLSNFRLDFEMFDLKYWNGAYATIAEDSGSVVWGALWILDNSDMAHLDDQKGLMLGAYKVRNVSVQTPDGNTLMARTYQMTVNLPKEPVKDLPPERQPSDMYMKVILYGAFECSQPMHYIRHLFTFPTNGKLTSLNALNNFGTPFNVTAGLP